MSNHIKAFLLTPIHSSQTIQIDAIELEKEPDCDEPKLQSLYSNLKCTMVQILPCSERGELNGHSVFTDEEGLFKSNEGFIFCPQISRQPIAGNIILLKTTEFGVTDVEISIDVLRKMSSLVYVNPRFAAHALLKHETQIRASHPDVIVMGSSKLIFDRL